MNQKSVSIVLPHQLFDPNPSLDHQRPVLLLEEFLFFRQYSFHKTKLVFHRASMQAYYKLLITSGYKVEYLDCVNHPADIRQIIPMLSQKGVQEVHYCDPVDDWLETRLKETALQHGIRLVRSESPAFLHSEASIRQALGSKKKYFQTDFYIRERRRLKLLLDAEGNPEGGRWTFDTENRKPWPKGKPAPLVAWPDETAEVAEAKAWVEKYFGQNPGAVPPHFPYPVSHKAANAWLEDFIRNRLNGFGPYEDAIVGHEILLHHSMLSPLLNIGLLRPEAVVETAVEAIGRGEAQLPSVEGFVRQIVGWREFIRGVYVLAGRKERSRNYFGFSHALPEAFYQATTGVEPVDITIRKLLGTAYNHHIERLMVLGNFMLLCEIRPDEVYRWFMEMYIDAYDWVMVPNVYGMSQFADGGLMSTKPYFSGSRYLLSMSDYSKGGWTEIWDALFWRFIHRYRGKLKSNPRIGMLSGSFDRMAPQKQAALLENAERFLQSLHKNPANINNQF